MSMNDYYTVETEVYIPDLVEGWIEDNPDKAMEMLADQVNITMHVDQLVESVVALYHSHPTMFQTNWGLKLRNKIDELL